MSRHIFSCIDGHTCGNPVRLVAGGGPLLKGSYHDGAARRFPRPPRLDPQRPDVRAARPRRDERLDPLSADARRLRHRDPVHRDLGLPLYVRPRHHRHRHDGDRERADDAEDAGRRATSTCRPARWSPNTRMDGEYVDEVRITNVPSFLHSRDLEIDAPGLGKLTVDVAYGGNFYCIVDPQENFTDLADVERRRPAALEPGAAHGDERALQLRPSGERRHPRLHPHHVDRQAAEARLDRAQRRVLRRQGDRPLALRHRHLGAHGAVVRRAASSRSATPSSTRSIIGSIFNGRVEKAVHGRQLRRHRPLDRRLGPPDRPQHHLHRRPRPVRARLLAGLRDIP